MSEPTPITAGEREQAFIGRIIFDRAAAEGDARALTVLDLLRIRPCRGALDPCCIRVNPALAKTIGSLDARLKKK